MKVVILAGGMIRGGYYGDVGVAGNDGDGHSYFYKAPRIDNGQPGPSETGNKQRLPGKYIWRTVAKALKSGVPIRIVCNEACAMSVKASISKSLAKATGLGKKAIVVASGKGALGAAGTLTIKVKFTKQAKAFLAGRLSLPLSFSTVVTDTAGNRSTKTSKATVKTQN